MSEELSDLQIIENELAVANKRIVAFQETISDHHKIIEILIAAGFITREKYQEAENIINDLD